MQFSTTVRVPRPIGDVFAALADRSNRPLPKTVSVEQTPPGPVGLETVFTFHNARRPAYFHTATIREFDPPTRLSFELNFPGHLPMWESYTIEAAGEATIIRSVAEVTGFTRWRRLDPIMGLLYRPVYVVGARIGYRMLRRIIDRTSNGK